GLGIEEKAIERWGDQVEVVETVHYDITHTDFMTELGLIDAANPEAVLYVGYYEDGRVILRQALTLGLDKYPWFCSEGIYGDALIYQDTTPLTDVAEFLRRCANGTTPVAPVGLESAELFKQRYEDEYGTPPPMYCDTAYDATWLAILSIAHAGVYDGAEIRESLEVIGPFYLGGSGWKLFDENGDMLMQTYEIWNVQLNATSGEYHFVGTGSYWP
ncbi:MAG: ABC transporter substrate-binding protein, partial [archaeon]|nr:ABC transporter substrate-binding protein [archaeon]